MNSRGFTLIEGLLIFIVLAVIGFGTFYVASDSIEDQVNTSDSVQLDENIKTQNIEEESPRPQEQSTASPITDEEVQLYSEGYRNDEIGVLIDFLIGEGFSNYWIEYGQTPDGLTESSSKISDGLGYEFGGTFGSFTAVIDPTTLPDGDNIYFYRIAAEKQGTVYYTGTNAFNYK